MAQKSKAASLTPDLLMSKNVPAKSAPRKQAADLSLAPGPTASQIQPAQPAQPAAPPPAKAKSKVKEIEPARLDNAERPSGDAPATPADTDGRAAPPPSQDSIVPAPAPAEANGGADKAAIADGAESADAYFDHRIRIPVPLDPSEHLELTLAAARSGRSCQEIIVEALFRYLEDIAGPPDRPAAPGPDGPR